MRARDKFVQNTWYEMYLVQIHFKELKGLSDDVTKKYWIWYCVLVGLVAHEVEVGSLESRS